MSKEKDFLYSIIYFLKDNSKISEIKNDEELKEIDIDMHQGNLFESLYHNLICFYKNYEDYNTIISEIQKYFRREITDVLVILYENRPKIFFENDFIKSVIIYLINSFKYRINIYPEFILNIFFGFMNLIKHLSHSIINKEVENFETGIVNTIKSLINKYKIDYQKQLEIPKENHKFKNIISYLSEYTDYLPNYLGGFLEYSTMINPKKFIIIKIYKYFELINPYEKDYNNIDFNLYQGYKLYGIISNKNESNLCEFSFKEFNNIKNNRITNINAKMILDLAIKLLKSRSYDDFIRSLNDENSDFIGVSPKISKNFDNTKEYYKDIHEQLKYYLNQYISDNKKMCKILTFSYQRVFWLNFNKLFILNLSENDLNKNEIKIIFYFIVNLFNPEINDSSLEFNLDTVPMLLAQCQIGILDNLEIYKILDKNYSQYYPKYDEKNEFMRMYIDSINQEILSKFEVKDFLEKKSK